MLILLRTAPTVSAVKEAIAAAPDALVLDLAERPRLKTRGGRTLERALTRGSTSLFVRIPPLATSAVEGVLAVAMTLRPDAILLAGATGRPEIEQLAVKLAVLEAEHDRMVGSIRILASVADHAAGTLALAGLKPNPRLAGLVFDGEALAGSLGCAADAQVLSQAAAMTILAASACRVPAIMRLGDGTGESEASRSPPPKRNSYPPHAEVPAEGRPRSTRDRFASFEASLREAPQDEEGGSFWRGAARDALREGFTGLLIDDPRLVAGLRALTPSSGASGRTSSRASRRNSRDSRSA